jgi:FKBP-type peptidyl-prolyl cis-trans isomerase (trigger factor)
MHILVMPQISLFPNSNTTITKPKTTIYITQDLEKQIDIQAKRFNLVRKVKCLR